MKTISDDVKQKHCSFYVIVCTHSRDIRPISRVASPVKLLSLVMAVIFDIYK